MLSADLTAGILDLLLGPRAVVLVLLALFLALERGVLVLVLSMKPRALPQATRGTGHAPLMSRMSMRRSTRW